MSVDIDPDAVVAVASSISTTATTVPTGRFGDLEACGSTAVAAAADEFAVWRDFAWRQLNDSLESVATGAQDAVDAYRTADGSAEACFANPAKEFPSKGKP